MSSFGDFIGLSDVCDTSTAQLISKEVRRLFFVVMYEELFRFLMGLLRLAMSQQLWKYFPKRKGGIIACCRYRLKQRFFLPNFQESIPNSLPRQFVPDSLS